MHSALPILYFKPFALDRANRRLLRDGEELDVGSRYFDALVLLVEARGQLVTKDRFMEEVWRGVPVTDEALTQCIRSLRRALSDDAAAPRFIATVPKHGYRFVGELYDGEALDTPKPDTTAPDETSLALGSAGRLAASSTLGGAMAGLLGGAFYAGLLSMAVPEDGSAVFLTVLSLCLAVGILGGAGVGIGMALLTGARGVRAFTLVAGGGAGGLVVGALGRLLGLDLFRVLAGVGIGPVTGLLEGAIVGMLAGGGCALVMRYGPRIGAILAGLVGAIGGAVLALAGGRLMAGSLLLLDRSLEGSRLQLDRMGTLLGEGEFGTVSLILSAGLEAAVFVTCVALAVGKVRSF
ncbi:winged helix-turn-helix domain-containing protein [Aurantiacibacter rhizosphaerae]|uniref:Transcriptional regulator n=1 Tax=Aurantiacibacter rhizosphaerae TaxID=2691582 RepID=A0A844XC09_9SPHN|nr:transcriptional regulator [Aurantiacibacter rhizosphaerae]MWV27045.1 transcriptional regulator [Aurantiacibacter rhizosphaerae]